MESLCKHKSTILVYMILNVRVVVVVYMGTIVFHTHFICVFITVKAVTIFFSKLFKLCILFWMQI